MVLTTLPASAQPKEWLLVQDEDTYRQMIVRVTEQAVRLEVPSMGFVIISKAPDWRVNIFRDDDKIEWHGPMENFSGRQLANPYVDPTTNKRVLPAAPANFKSIEICRLPGKLYKTSYASYACADEIKVDPSVVKLFNRLHSCPLLPSVPLKISTVRKNLRPKKQEGKDPDWMKTDYMDDLRTGEVTVLNTSNVVKVPFNPKDFELPKGYKRMRDPIEVSYSASKKDELNDLINNVGFVGKIKK